jgi:hypothetical protein
MEKSDGCPEIGEETHPRLGRVLRAHALIPVGTVLMRERPVMSSTPFRVLDAEERAAVLGAADMVGTLGLDLICMAHAFGRASPAERARVLSTFCGTDAIPPELRTGSSREQLAAVDRVAGWARHHLHQCAHVALDELRQALMCYKLNAHHSPQLSDKRRGALYALGSKFTHACLSANCAFEHDAAGTRLVHRAMRTIEPGTILTTNYLGAWEYGSRHARQALLLASKCFECQCATCEARLDTLRALPCPSCGQPRDANGLLPAPARGMASIESAVGRVILPYSPYSAAQAPQGAAPQEPQERGARAEERWLCARCGSEFGASEVDIRVQVDEHWPLIAPPSASDDSAGELTLLGWERCVEMAAHNLLAHVSATTESERTHPTVAKLPAIRTAVHQLFGGGHWTASFLLAIELEAALALTERMAARPDSKLLRACADELGLAKLDSVAQLLGSCARHASELCEWQRARAPHAATPLFDEMVELAGLALRVPCATPSDTASHARVADRGQGEAVLASSAHELVLALGAAELARLERLHGCDADEARALRERLDALRVRQQGAGACRDR